MWNPTFQIRPIESVGFASRAQPTDLTNQLVDTAAAGLYTYGVKPLDINDAAFMSNIAHKLAAGFLPISRTLFLLSPLLLATLLYEL